MTKLRNKGAKIMSVIHEKGGFFLRLDALPLQETLFLFARRLEDERAADQP